MLGATRQGDSTTGSCPYGSRGGTNSEVSSDVIVNGKGVHRVSDTGPTNCPQGALFVSNIGSSTVFANGQPITRIGDVTKCNKCGQSGTHSTGSDNVIVGG